MKHKANLSITRPSYGDGSRKISITVKDKDARIRFLDIEIDYDKFAECITGLSEIECTMKVRGLENVGKNIETMTVEFGISGPQYNIDKEDIIMQAKEHTPEGWTCSTYFGSKSSFFEIDGKDFARTTASRWVDK